MPFTLQTNLQRAFEIAKDAGLWILGTSEHANDDLAPSRRIARGFWFLEMKSVECAG